MRDLEDLDRRELEMAGDVRFRVGGEQRIRLAVGGDEDDSVVVRVVAGCAGPIRPQDSEPQPADPERLARARDDDLYPALARGFPCGPLLPVLARNRRVENGADGELLQDL